MQLLPLLQGRPHLSTVALLEELQRRHPGEYGPSALRTLQRRMRSGALRTVANARYLSRRNIRRVVKGFRISRR